MTKVEAPMQRGPSRFQVLDVDVGSGCEENLSNELSVAINIRSVWASNTC